MLLSHQPHIIQTTTENELEADSMPKQATHAHTHTLSALCMISSAIRLVGEEFINPTHRFSSLVLGGLVEFEHLPFILLHKGKIFQNKMVGLKSCSGQQSLLA